MSNLHIIHKYEINNDEQEIELGADYRILSFHIHKGRLYVWFQHNIKVDYPKAIVKLTVVNTGESVSEEWKYLSTVFFENSVVQHIYQTN